MTDPKVTGEVDIQLDRQRSIKFGNYTHYRLSRFGDTLDGPWNYYRALVYIWAMLPKSALARFPDPEDLSEFITTDNLGTYLEALLQAIASGLEPDEEKKSTSKPGLSTASKSG